MCLVTVVGIAADQLVGPAVDGRAVVAGGAAAFLTVAFERGRFRQWVRAQRAEGRFSRKVVVVGASGEASALIDVLAESPELGFIPVAFAGRIEPDAAAPAVPWAGGTENIVATVAACGANGVVIAAMSVPSMELNRMVRDLHRHRVHVQLSSGISGIHHRRMRVQTVGCQPLIYVEPTRLSLLQSAAKRGLDIVGAIVGILVGAPLVMFAALVVKLGDRGPALFAQQRVGRDGRTFMMFKLRTMRVDAEERLRDLCDQNERDGPLFKITDDPRVTRVGRFLRATSIDELPQLLNVLAGSMSLVGPRPALPTEVDQFAHAEVRHAVRPGITGLWQVEARDSPSFNTYQRLDLFYVENWSVWLDLAVLLRTGRAVISRARRASSVARHPTGSFDSASATTSRRDCEPVAPKANGASASAPLACRDEGNTVQVATSTRAPPGGGAI
jgi:exopolysaccharide biosynthesis polyprenyl glycosylphosphotransferase